MIASWWSPQTDLGVLVQAIVTLLAAGALIWVTRREPSIVLLIIGITLVFLGWYGIRGLH